MTSYDLGSPGHHIQQPGFGDGAPMVWGAQDAILGMLKIWRGMPPLLPEGIIYNVKDIYCVTQSQNVILLIYYLLWYTMIYYDILWCTMIYYDVLWYTVIYYDILWYTMISVYLSIYQSISQSIKQFIIYSIIPHRYFSILYPPAK